jgi:hypothetical protein
LYWTAFSSTSKDENIAKRFASNNGIIFIIKISENRPYHNLEIPLDWSYFPSEKEVLLMPNFHFRVTNRELKEGYDYIYI